jgi:hypothetical protein
LDIIVIKRDGKPVAALVDARLFERIRRLQARFDGLCERIEAGYAEVPEAEGLAEIEAAVAASRAERFGALEVVLSEFILAAGRIRSSSPRRSISSSRSTRS